MIPTPLRKYADARSRFEVPAATVKGAIQALVNDHPDLGRHLLDDKNVIRSFVRIYVDESDMLELQGEETPVEARTVISIVPAIAGGTPTITIQ